MKAYANAGPSEAGTANKTAVTVIGSTAVRARLYDLTIGSAGTPADYGVKMGVRRFTADGTGTAQTPLPLDPGEVAAVCTAKITYTAEPTYDSTYLLRFGMNLRATYRWVATPGQELVALAAAGDGLGVEMVALTTSGLVDATIHYYE